MANHLLGGAEFMKEFLTDLIDNDTLCLVGALVLAIMQPDLRNEVAVGFLAFMGLKPKK